MVHPQSGPGNAPKPRPPLFILYPDGKRVRLDPALVEREKLAAGMLTPFTRLLIVADVPADSKETDAKSPGA